MFGSRTGDDGGPSTGRLLLVATMVVALVLAAGCSGIVDGGGDGGDGGDAGPALDSVPDGVDSVAFVDVRGAMADDELTALANEFLALEPTGPQNVSEAVDRAEANSTLSASEVHSVTAFGSTNATTVEEGYGAAILDTEWEAATLVNELQNNSNVSLESTSVAGKTVWEPTGDDEATAEASYVGKLATGLFVVGSEGAVIDSVKTRTGNLDPFAGELRTSFEDTREGAYVRYASTVPQDRVDPGEVGAGEVFNRVQLVSGSQYTADGEVALATTMSFDTPESANSANQSVRGLVTYYRGQSASGPLADLVSAENLSIEHEDTELTLTLSNTAEGYVQTLGGIYDMFLGFGGGLEAEYAAGETAVGPRAGA